MNTRKHLTQNEVARLIEATRGNRNEARDRCLLLIMFRHGLRASEACAMRLAQIDLEGRVLHVARLKRGLSTTHPLRPDELRAIKSWLQRRREMAADSDALFLSERRKPLDRRTVWALLRNYGKMATTASSIPCSTPPPTRQWSENFGELNLSIY